MAYIGKTPATGNFIKLDAITCSSTNTYNLQYGSTAYTPESVNHMLVSLNGVIQAPTTAFTVSGSQITFIPASGTLSSSDTIDFIMVYGNVLDIGTPSDATVTNAKIVDVAASKLTGTIADARFPATLPAASGVNLTALNASNLGSGTVPTARLGSGTANSSSFLRGDQTYATISSDWVKIAHTNVSSAVSSVDLVHGTGGVVIDSTYRYYKLFCTWRPSTNGAVLRVRVANSGTFRTTGYLAEVFRSYYSGGTSRTNSTEGILLGTGGTQNATEQRSNAELTFHNMSDASLNTTAQLLSQAIDGSGNTENQVNNQIGGGCYATAEAHNGIRVYMDSGNIEAGDFVLYGIKG